MAQCDTDFKMQQSLEYTGCHRSGEIIRFYKPEPILKLHDIYFYKK